MKYISQAASAQNPAGVCRLCSVNLTHPFATMTLFDGPVTTRRQGKLKNAVETQLSAVARALQTVLLPLALDS